MDWPWRLWLSGKMPMASRIKGMAWILRQMQRLCKRPAVPSGSPTGASHTHTPLPFSPEEQDLRNLDVWRFLKYFFCRAKCFRGLPPMPLHLPAQRAGRPVQILVPNRVRKLLGVWKGGGGGGGGSAGQPPGSLEGGRWVPQHTYLNMIPMTR